MPTTSDRCPIEPRPDTAERYTSVETDDGETIIFDQNLESAWIQSDFAIELEAME